MEKFQDISHYLKVVEDFKASHENLVGNLTTTKKELEGVILEGRLFYSVFPHTLLIFRDELDYWQTMLLTDGEEEEILLPEGKPYAAVVMNAMKKGNLEEILRSKLTSMQIPLVAKCSSYRTIISDSYPVAKSIVDDMKPDMEAKGYKFLPFKPEYIDEIHDLWNKYLYRYNCPKEQWNLEIAKENILLLFDTKISRPKLIAVVCFFKNKASWISAGLAVEAEYRHDMVGIYIDAMQHIKLHEAGINALYSWKVDGNKRAIKLGEMLGTKKMPLECWQFYSA